MHQLSIYRRARRALHLSLAVCGLALCQLTHAQAVGELRLIAAELPPFTYQSPSASVAEVPGPGAGIFQDTVTEMARRIGHSGRIEYMPWFRAQEIAKSQKNIGILALTRSPERELQYQWAVKLISDDLVLAGAPGVDVSSLSRVKMQRVGVLHGSGAEALLRAQQFTRISPQPEEWLNAKRIKDRSIDAWVAPRTMVVYAMREVRGNLDTLQIGQIIRQSDIYLAMSKDVSESEVARWQKAFMAMQADGSFQKILRKYRSMSVDPIEDDKRRIQDNPFAE